MNIEVLKTTWKSPLALFAAAVTAASPVASATPAANVATTTAAATNLPVTLPVLDAMFADEAFAGELKSKLQLTDEQVENLRKVAGEERASLDEGGADLVSSTAR